MARCGRSRRRRPCARCPCGHRSDGFAGRTSGRSGAVAGTPSVRNLAISRKRRDGIIPVMTTAPPTPGYAIEAFEVATLPNGDIRQVAELRNALNGERSPEDPPTPTEVVVDRLRARPKMIEFTEWLARAADGQIVGAAALIRIVAETNQHYRQTEIGVLPGHRRRGLSRC